MQLADVNVLLTALNVDSPQHPASSEWLRARLASAELFAVSELILSSVVRIATNRSVYAVPSSLETVLAFADAMRRAPNARVVSPARHHWTLFSGLCLRYGIVGPDVTDAYLAALAIEHSCEFVTDRFL